MQFGYSPMKDQNYFKNKQITGSCKKKIDFDLSKVTFELMTEEIEINSYEIIHLDTVLHKI